MPQAVQMHMRHVQSSAATQQLRVPGDSGPPVPVILAARFLVMLIWVDQCMSLRSLRRSTSIQVVGLIILGCAILGFFAAITPNRSHANNNANNKALTIPTIPVPTTAPSTEFGHTGLVTQYAGSDVEPDVVDYNSTSPDDGSEPQQIRVLKPTHPAPGVAHNFLFVLPVQPGADNLTYGDGLDTIARLNAQNTYNLTVIEPSFAIDPWYANSPVDPHVQYETFMSRQLEPWVKATLSITGDEQSWLIGFSKSGLGAQDLLLKHPDLFTLAASWDFPAGLANFNGLGDSTQGYGTNANFQANYRLTPAFLEAHRAPFASSNRIWIGSYSRYGPDVTTYDALLTSVGILHSTENPTRMTHAWDSGWVPMALSALHQESLLLQD
jgi:hypothetical protein